MDNDKLFVGIKNHRELRKNLLESSKIIIRDLKRYQDFKALKSEKAEKINRLKVVMADIRKLSSKLVSEIPKTETEIVKPKTSQVRRPEIKQEQKKDVKKVKTELEKLEDELQKIETKLSAIK